MEQELFPFADGVRCGVERAVLCHGEILAGLHRLERCYIIAVIEQHVFLAQLSAESVCNGDRIGRDAGVPVPVVLAAQRSDDCHFCAGSQMQRQDAVVVEQAHLFHGGNSVDRTVEQGVGLRRLGVVGAAVAVEFAQAETAGQRVSHSTVDVCLGEESSVQGISCRSGYHIIGVGHNVVAVFQTGGKCLGVGGVGTVRQYILGEVCTVGHDEFQTPYVFHQRLQVGIHARRNAAQFVIGGHHRTGAATDDG